MTSSIAPLIEAKASIDHSNDEDSVMTEITLEIEPEEEKSQDRPVPTSGLTTVKFRRVVSEWPEF